MRQRRSLLTILASLLSTTLVVSACGDSDSKTSGTGDGLEKTTITVASLPLVDAAGLHIAVSKKFFEAEGLQVQIKPIAQSILAMPALKKGDVDVIAGGNYVTFLQAAANGELKTRIIADGTSEAPRFFAGLVAAKSSIKQPKDLEGKTVAVNVLNNIQTLTFNEVLKANNVDPSKVKYRQVPFPQMAAALQRGQVDAVHTAEPFGTDIQRKLGARLILDGGGAPVTDLPVSGYITTQDFVQKNPKTAAAFQRAIQKAQQLAGSDRKQVEAVLPGYAHVDAQTAAALSLPNYPTSLNPTRMQRLPDLMLRDGLLKSPLSIKSVIFAPPAK
jgi:NitT/TauT family transport system substrate-binding protein